MLALLGGILAASGSRAALVPLGFAAVAVLLPVIRQRAVREGILRGALLTAVGILGAHCQVTQEQTWNEELLRLPTESEVCLTGTLTAKEQKQNSWQLMVRLPDMENQLLVSVQDGDHPLDCILRIRGSVVEFEPPRNEGQFNEKTFYKSRQVIARVYADEITVIRAPSGAGRWREYLYMFRERVQQVYEACLPTGQAGILSAMALGDRRMLDTEVRALFQQAGISHILAISGLHISLIGAGCFGLLRRFRLSYVQAAAVAAAWMLLYGTLIGAGISAYRAIGMFFVYLLAQCLGKSYDSCSALAALAAVCLLQNPSVLYDVSFQLSFIAVAAAVSAKELLPDQRGCGRAERLLQTACMSLLIQLATLPLIAWYYYELPLYALLFNLVLLPLVGVVLGFGLIGGCAGVLLLPLGRLLLLPSRIVLSVQLWVCAQTARLPAALCICGKPTKTVLWVYVLLLFSGLLLLEWRQERYVRQSAQRKTLRERSALRCRARIQAAGLILVLALLLHGWLLCAPLSENGVQVTYLDVGQGDAAVIRTSGGTVCFIDGGSTDVSKVGTYRILPYLKANRIRQVDYWILSHLDEDHVSGFYEVLDSGFPVKTVVVSAWMPQDAAAEELRERLTRAGISLITADAAQTLLPDETARLDLLSPSEQTPFSDGNGASLVCLYADEDPDTKKKLRALFTGDIATEQEQWLLSEQVLSAVDLYKAAHHGSKYANSADFLAALSPRLCVISCAAENRYGHPAAEAVANMQASGSRLLYTMKSGQITVRFSDGRLVAEEYVKKD